jgi:hypothetical protein
MVTAKSPEKKVRRTNRVFFPFDTFKHAVTAKLAARLSDDQRTIS